MIDDNSKEFIRRHIGPSEEDQAKMLAAVGYKSLNDLMVGTVPTIKSSNDLYPIVANIFDWSSSDGPMCLLINSFELSSII